VKVSSASCVSACVSSHLLLTVACWRGHDALQDVPFFFDVHLPADYPNEPPAISFFSYGERLNPNLYVYASGCWALTRRHRSDTRCGRCGSYETGKVCLSLLGTWSSTQPGEQWEPGSSNLMQVLISIQGLILVEQPFCKRALASSASVQCGHTHGPCGCG
jgi:ubiquitin-protein ligase